MAIKRIVHKSHTFDIAYDIKNPHERKSALFLHGWGSDKELMMKAFSSSLPNYRHIYLDLPGFGKSGNETVLTTSGYADIVSEFLSRIETRPDVVVGHSFGGKVAALLDPGALVLLSSAGIVMPKPLKVRLKISLFKMLKPLGSDRLGKFFASADASGMPRNMYETFKNVVDEDFSDIFAGLSSSTLVCWGERDSATPLEAGKRIAALIPDANFEIFEGDHYFFLYDSAPVIKSMEDFLEKI
ncbi:alpha/beta fold hydrolase [Hydrogenimonas sp.]